MSTATKIQKTEQKNKAFENKSLYAAIKKTHELSVDLTLSEFRQQVKQEFITWSLEDFNFYELELVSTYQEKGTTFYVLEDQQFLGYETVCKTDIESVSSYPTVKERVLDLEDFENGNIGKAIDYVHKNMPCEFSQLCAFAVKYKYLIGLLARKFKPTMDRYIKTKSIQNKMDHALMELAPITQEDY